MQREHNTYKIQVAHERQELLGGFFFKLQELCNGSFESRCFVNGKSNTRAMKYR